MSQNLLFYGDNLTVLRGRFQDGNPYVPDNSVDLIYLDPPFNSNANYNVYLPEHGGSLSTAQLEVFKDTWTWSEAAPTYFAFIETNETPDKARGAMIAFRGLLGETPMLAYLSMMAPRLVELRKKLKDSGNLFLHCDTTASHYLKVLMDAVFTPRTFVNEIIWYYYNKIQGNIHHFPSNHDTIFWYSKTPEFFFRPVREKRDKTMRQLKRVWDKEKKSLVNAKDEFGKVMYQDSDNRRVDDVWRLAMLQPASREKLDYPTQKPSALLERIIAAACPDEGVVLDPFCGCGTTISAAQKLGRKWVGIDITSAATNLIKNRLRETYNTDQFSIDKTYRVVGEPTKVSEAKQLAETDYYQFQWWALGLVGARPAVLKKGGDRGVDGRLIFHDEDEKRSSKQVIFSVKAGQALNPAMVRDLGHVVDRDKAAIGVLLTVRAPTPGMKAEAAGGGKYRSPWGTEHPRLQILTVGELLEGKQVDMPQTQDVRTFKKAPRARKTRPDYNLLPLRPAAEDQIKPGCGDWLHDSNDEEDDEDGD